MFILLKLQKGLGHPPCLGEGGQIPVGPDAAWSKFTCMSEILPVLDHMLRKIFLSEHYAYRYFVL